MKKLFVFLFLIFPFIGNSNAELIEVMVSGDGMLENFNTSEVTDIGFSTLDFTYNSTQFIETGIFSFSGGVGKEFTSITPISVNFFASGTTYNLEPITKATVFDQPSINDQFNFESSGITVMQWNDFTSTSFNAPIPSSFDDVSARFIDQITNNPNLLLSGFFQIYKQGDPDTLITINNPTVSFTTVPIPAALWLFSSALIGLVALNRKS